jgi:hypothetical protein
VVLGRVNRWEFAAFLVAFGLGIFPQVGISICGVFGLVAFVQKRLVWQRTWWIIIGLYAVLRIPWYARGETGLWYGLLDVAFTLSVLIGVIALEPYFSKRFAFGLALGASIAVIAAALPVWSFSTPTTEWHTPYNLVKVSSIGGIDKLTPLDAQSSWLNRDLGYQGSGEIEYRFELQSERPARIAIWFQRTDLPGNTFPQTCTADNTQWRTCSVRVKLKQRLQTVLVLGTWATWKSSSGQVQFRNPHLYILKPPSWAERLLHSSRAVGWSFNENGFGVWMASVATLILLTSGSGWSGWYLIAPCVLGVFLSDSRNALVILILASLLTMFSRLKPRFLLIACGSAVAILMFFQIIIPKSIFAASRFFDIFSDNGRINIYRTAWHLAWQKPLFGWGDFNSALRKATIDFTNGTVPHSHSIWLQTFGESGLIGIACLIGLIFMSTFIGFKTRNRLILIVLGVVLFANSVDLFFYYSPIFFLFWFPFSKTHNDILKP